MIEKGDILNDLDCKWCIPFTSLRTEPEFEQSTVIFKLHSSVSLKLIPIFKRLLICSQCYRDVVNQLEDVSIEVDFSMKI